MSWGVAISAGLMALAAAVLAVTRDSVVHALLLLLAVLIALAVAFFALAAPFAGAIQLLIYAGAVVAVFVFVMMTVDTGPEARAHERALMSGTWKVPAAVLLLAMALILIGQRGAGPIAVETPAPQTGPVALGVMMFGDWALVTELISILLIAGMIGVRVVGRRPGRSGRCDAEEDRR